MPGLTAAPRASPATFPWGSSMSKRCEGFTLMLGSASLPGGGNPGILCTRDFELTDEQIVTCFKLLQLETATWPSDIRRKWEAFRELLANDGQQARLARWVNGIECVLYFDQHRQCPQPEQLLRAYKNAFAARAFMSRAAEAPKGQA